MVQISRAHTHVARRHYFNRKKKEHYGREEKETAHLKKITEFNSKAQKPCTHTHTHTRTRVPERGEWVIRQSDEQEKRKKEEENRRDR
jgi:hypothetical protein